MESYNISNVAVLLCNIWYRIVLPLQLPITAVCRINWTFLRCCYRFISISGRHAASLNSLCYRSPVKTSLGTSFFFFLLIRPFSNHKINSLCQTEDVTLLQTRSANQLGRCVIISFPPDDLISPVSLFCFKEWLFSQSGISFAHHTYTPH